MIKKLMTVIGLLASVLHLQSKDNSSRDIIAAVIMGEGRSEGECGMLAIAEVIRNRGGDPVKVVTARRQFSCMNSRSSRSLVRSMKREHEWPTAIIIATALLTHPEDLGNMAKGANHYETVGRTPFWAIGLRPVATIGNLNFYKCQ